MENRGLFLLSTNAILILMSAFYDTLPRHVLDYLMLPFYVGIEVCRPFVKALVW